MANDEQNLMYEFTGIIWGYKNESNIDPIAI